jgi:hypothetical protein
MHVCICRFLTSKTYLNNVLLINKKSILLACDFLKQLFAGRVFYSSDPYFWKMMARPLVRLKSKR